MNPWESEFGADGNFRGLQSIKLANEKKGVLVVRNNDHVKLFEYESAVE